MTTQVSERRDITVTVVITTYNRGRYLRQALDSVLAQTRPAEQIIVVNDGSTDDTQRILAGYGDQIEVLTQGNAGKPAALNRALKTARGSHIWIFDDDDLALPHALASHVEFLTAHPKVDFSYSRNYVFRGDDGIEASRRWRRGTYHFIEFKPLVVALLYDCELIFQALLVPAVCFREAGYFDESLARANDYDMLIKLARRYRGGCNDTETMVWRDHYGDRGPAGERHGENERPFWARHYERRIFANVWSQFALAEYIPDLVDENGAGELSATQTRAALLQRCEIMFRHDLPQYADDDLARVAAAVDHGSAAFTAMAAVVRRAADVADPVFIPTAQGRARHLARAISWARSPLRLSGAALKGFYWAIARAARKQRPRDAARVMGAAATFTAALAGHRFKNRFSPARASLPQS